MNARARPEPDDSSAFRDELLSIATGAPRDAFFSALHEAMRRRFDARALVAAVLDADGVTELHRFYPHDVERDEWIAHIDRAALAAALRAGGPTLLGLSPNGAAIVAPVSVRSGGSRVYLAVASPQSNAFDTAALAYAGSAAQVAALVIAAWDAAEHAGALGEEVRMLLATARALASERDLQRLFARFHELVGSVMDARTFFIALGSYDSGFMEYPYAVDTHGPVELPATPIEATVAGHVFKDGKSYLMNSAADWERLPTRYEIHGEDVLSAIFAPMAIGNRTIGVISVQSPKPNVYTERNRELLVAIAEQGAIAVENSQYLMRAEQRAKELNLLAEVSKALSRHTSLKELCRTVCKEVRRVVDAPVFFVALRTADKRQLRVEYAVDGTVEREFPDYPIRDTIAESVIDGNVHVLFRNRAELEAHPHRWLDAMEQGIRSLVMVPLRTGNECIGVMTCQCQRDNAYDDASARLITSIAEQLALAVENSRLYVEATSRADRDPLTNIFHHRYLKSRLEEELERSREFGRPVAVVMLDVDYFKLVNDSYGHLVGDDALRLVTSVIQHHCRKQNDVVGRYGGDEFMAILPESEGEAAMLVATRIESELRSRLLKIEGIGDIPIRCSIGVASFPADGKTPAEVIAKADARLYQSKRQGKTVGQYQRIGTTELRLTGNFEPVAELLAALLARDPATREHLEHVNHIALQFSRALDLDEEDTQSLLLASVLHDVGKIAIPDQVLRKPGPLSEPERGLVQRHPVIGATLIENIPGFARAAVSVRHHHEQFGGGGYPDGLSRERIPYLARVVTIIDAFSAMTVNRPYHGGRSTQEAVAELRRCAGSQFDPQLVERFARLVEDGGL